MLKVLVPPNWLEPMERAIRARNLQAELVPFDEQRCGPFPGVEVFFRGEGAWNWKQILAGAPDVKWLHLTSAGVEHSLDVVRQRGLLLTESGEVYRICIGEFVLAQMLVAVKRLNEHARRQERQEWAGLRHEELFGRTVGIIGVGPIGLGVAERAKAFGMRVLGVRRSGQPATPVDEVLPPAQLDRLLAESDFVVLACPLTAETRGIISAAALAKMKPSAWLCNIARGALVDTEALVAALHEGRLAGACLDVTDPEPLPPGHPLWEMPNVFLTPHNASGDTPASRQRKVDWFVDNLGRYLAGRPLEGRVDVAREY